MLDQQKLYGATKRGALVLLLVCSFSVLAFASAPVAKSLSALVNGPTTRITIHGTAPMAYSVKRPDTHTLLIDLPGVDASRLSREYNFASPLISGVALERTASLTTETPARLHFTLRVPVRDRSQLNENDLVVELSPAGQDALSHADSDSLSVNLPQTTPTPTPTPRRTSNVTITQGQTSQQTDASRYGQQGFVGEPINLNVVNADIRDILNYITEQYGVNFVIDSSVGPVPVTVNVTDVPWNIALDAILRANRLGVDVNGNILRVATIDVLATEAAAQQKIRDAQLDTSPLVTEFLRLNYARASGTLAQAAGSTGGFAGGSTNLSYSGGAGGDATGGGGDQGLLPIISRRLSRRGSIEVDGRSNTLIITDVRENIESIRQLVAILDQPEPQVEIETRIVIASRNFSRDLGVQISAQFGGETGPRGGANTSLGAATVNTVVGLTTGIFGTAQISALITAGELKGQAKTVATPRVTALNNRPAQIESGQQIPVQTTQATGGATVVTTTFVSVPLRLSITPQITDAGTVVLRVTVENNSINTGIAVAGVPGINTQRMQSEVLVPDGGTTVMGGVLLDSEGSTQSRTPGLASVPVLGNLFKRKSITRATDEILFFITPRIYRPDYQGRPVSNTATTGTRTTTISQPVPLGNPPSNTPTPTQLQQQQQQPSTNTPVTPIAPQQTVSPTPNAPVARPGTLGGSRP
ncbi:MAG TPA: type IV pilus secretin PilQ [Pyrinomonadaceae bacterium]|jgi:type IV pilus assembly protein PilQ